MRNKLGFKKHKKCEQITKKMYEVCYSSENETIAKCIYIDNGYKCDLVNYKTGEWKEDIPTKL